MDTQFRAVHIVGDIHGHKHSLRKAYEAGYVQDNDLVICLGDVGINYGSETNRKGERDAFAKFPFQFLFLYGNHEQRPEEIESYVKVPVATLTKDGYFKNDCGVVYMDPSYPNQWFAIDGAAYMVGYLSILTVGGATSIDKHRRKPFQSWWPTENIRYQDIEKALNHGTNHFSLILSHTCPEELIPVEDKYNNPDEKLLSVLYEQLKWDYWFCGHWHMNEAIPEEGFYFLDANLTSDDKLTFITFNMEDTEVNITSGPDSLF